MTSIQAVNLFKSFRSKEIIKDVSLTLRSSEIVGVLGPNGAGKTTCFSMLIGLIKPTNGQIFINDQDVTHSPLHKRAQLGLTYLPQEISVFRDLSVQDNILAILEIQPNMTKSERHKRCEELLEEFGLKDIRDNKGIHLSGGEKRRTEVARALACNPQFILLDEPFAGVDPISIYEIKEQIVDLKRRGIGVLITDHNVQATLNICDRGYIIYKGSVLTEGTPSEITAHEKVKSIYLGDNFSV